MLTNICKFLFSLTGIATGIFSIQTFGAGIWALLFLAIAILTLVSIFVSRLALPALVLTRIAGVLSIAALVLLLVAGFAGGSFHLSDSNVILALALALLALFGLSAFFWDKE